MEHKGTLSVGARRKSYAFQLMAPKQISVWTKACLAMLLGSDWRDSGDANSIVNPNLMPTVLQTCIKCTFSKVSPEKKFLSCLELLYDLCFYYFLNQFCTLSRRRELEIKEKIVSML